MRVEEGGVLLLSLAERYGEYPSTTFLRQMAKKRKKANTRKSPEGKVDDGKVQSQGRNADMNMPARFSKPSTSCFETGDQPAVPYRPTY